MWQLTPSGTESWVSEVRPCCPASRHLAARQGLAWAFSGWTLLASRAVESTVAVMTCLLSPEAAKGAGQIPETFLAPLGVPVLFMGTILPLGLQEKC